MNYKPRHIHKAIWDHIQKKEYTIITGARQVGKTTLLRELFSEMKEAGYKVYYLTLENIKILQETNKEPENIFRFTDKPANSLDPESKRKDRIFLLIDEIQYMNDPSGFLKYLYDTYLENLKIIATGSSAFYIDSKFKDSLAGRKKIFNLKSLNFLEYLEFNDREDLSEEVKRIKDRQDYISLKQVDIYNYFDNYLIYGGYPAVVLENNPVVKQEKLMELRDSYVKRDVLESGIKNELEFFNLMAVTADQIGSQVNKHELSNTLGIHNATINKYLQTLEKCFHITLIKPFHKNLRKELTRMPKVYFLDTGLRNTLLSRFYPLNDRDDKGALLKNYVFLRLNEIFPNETIKYWRTTNGNEVDFVVSADFKTGQAFEVKYSRKELKNTGYQKFNKQYPGIPVQLITYEPHMESKSILTL
ncbi:MAG: ATP-binding protein [Bacteroidales bacterium]|nr:ATP-binding protein [Bacteroidales bacterium]